MNSQVVLKANRVLRQSSKGRVYLDESALQHIVNDHSSDELTDEHRAESKLRSLVMECGLKFADFPKLNLLNNQTTANVMERCEDIDFSCRYQHQFGILDGTIHLAYMPKEKVIDLSEVKQVVNFFCLNPQEENSLTQSIFKSLQILLQTDDVMVSTEAAFFGIQSSNELNPSSANRSVALGGLFQSENYPRQQLNS